MRNFRTSNRTPGSVQVRFGFGSGSGSVLNPTPATLVPQLDAPVRSDAHATVLHTEMEDFHLEEGLELEDEDDEEGADADADNQNNNSGEDTTEGPPSTQARTARTQPEHQ
ncbi:hypothetical protein B0H19DRAFT_1073665 [Mycena capillaripes]|nr:hypothetical protein B0H19DRAFT_1073665 [Mycena capillaripes]